MHDILFVCLIYTCIGMRAVFGVREAHPWAPDSEICPGTVDYPAGAGQPEMAVNLLSKRIVLVPPSE